MRLVILLLLLLSGCALAAPDTQNFTDDLGRTVAVPLHPQRIVSLHDLDITIPLLELGVVPVGSHGRTLANGQHTLRSARLLTGMDYDNTGMAFIGSADIDIEKVATLKPDLIITSPGRSADVAQLEKIAPTVSIDHLKGGAPRIYSRLATLTGHQAQLALLQARYQAQIQQLKNTLAGRTVTVSVLQASNGKIALMHSYHALGKVLRDAGFHFPALIENIPEDGRLTVSAERLPDLDADLIFDTWRGDNGGQPADEIAAMNAVMPGWCQFLRACRQGHYVMVSREEAISNSFAAMSLMVSVVQTQLAGLSLPPTAEGPQQ